ncbi:MAG: hypothetical protein AAF677_01995 [Pseudomonadota bacterium]
MIKLTTLAKMLFSAPLVGVGAFLLALPWVIPILAASRFAGEASAAEAFAPVNAALDRAVQTLAAALGGEGGLPAWFDPLAWAPLMLTGLIWLYCAQRTAMRSTGAGRTPAGAGRLIGNIAEWTVLSIFAPVLGLALVIGGTLAVTISEAAWPFHWAVAPSLPELLSAPAGDFKRELWSAYAGVPLLLVVAGAAVVVLTGRFMALQAAFVEGSDQRGYSARLPLAIAAFLMIALYYPVAAAAVWALVQGLGALGVAMAEPGVWTVMVLHFALVWCGLSAAAGYAARDEVVSSAQAMAEAARRAEPTPLGVLAIEDLDAFDGEDGQGDALSRRLRAWEANRQAA